MRAGQPRGRPATTPNLVMGANVQVCWEKFCRYWQVEPRLVPMEPGRLHLTGPEAAARCDENTIGVVAIMGSTMDGSYEPVLQISEALDKLQAASGHDIPIHVDGASGGFVAPFLHPDLEWDFRVPRVASINASGHKYGLVYPGVGWVVWRDAEALPEDLVFQVNYLGGEMPTFALNFSRPGAQVAAQYYNFLRLGFEGYRSVQQACQDVARYLSGADRRDGPVRAAHRRQRPAGVRVPAARPGLRPATRCSTCPSGCGSAAGWSPPTPSRRTCRTRRCCGSWSGTGSAWTWPTACSPTSARRCRCWPRTRSRPRR